MNVAIVDVGPSLDSRKQSLNPRAIAPDAIAIPFCFDNFLVFVEYRDKVFRAGENENIRFISILVFRQSLVGLSRDCRGRQIPPQSEWPISSARIIRKRKLKAKA